MQCLYCETELKPLRGLFDEDFCCKEHREKYFASFRKGIGLLPALDLPPLAPIRETIPETDAELAAEELLELAPLGEIEVEVTAAPAVLRALDERMPASESESLIEAVKELPLAALVPEPVLAVAEETRDDEPVFESPAQERKLEPALVPVLAASAQEPSSVSASVEAKFEDDGYEGAAISPPAADFLRLDIVPFGATGCYFMMEENSFPACNGPAIPDVEVFCDAAFDPEERLATLLDPAELMAAGAVSSDGRTASTEPVAQAPARLSRPAFRAKNDGRSTLPAFEVAEVIEEAEIVVAGHVSLAMARSAISQPMALKHAALELLAFHASAGDRPHPQVAEPMQLALLCLEPESAPLVFSELAPATQVQTPVFQVSAVAMQLDEDLKRAIEPPKTEAVRMAEPEIARPAVMSAAPVSRAVTAATFQPATVSATVRPDAQLNVPAMSSKTDVEPRLASEVVPDIAPGAGGEQPPTAHTSQPVQPAIETSASIKNWRLKITFAKPA